MARSNRKKTGGRNRTPDHVRAISDTKTVNSLLETMEEGNEYQSIVSVVPRDSSNLLGEIISGLKDIEKIRNRPCLTYIGNVVRADSGDSGINESDDLPFLEMIQKVPTSEKKIDILLATRGGSARQIDRFVYHLRARFEKVDFLLPSFCMSSGTLFALSGDNIWMTNRACLGPIDPQVPTKEGRYVPAQALLLLVDELRKQGQNAIDNGQAVPWTAIRIIDGIDKKELADANSATHYATMMASRFLVNYKFKNWKTRENNSKPVTDEYRQQRAEEIAKSLASHDKWKNHGHAISREVLWDEIKLRIEHPEGELEQAIIRFWALCTWLFDKTTLLKMIVSNNYSYILQQKAVSIPKN